MNDWVAKRFWTEVSVVPEQDGFAIRLDGRAVKTPAKAALIVPSDPLAQAIAAEWAQVEGKVNPNVMPFTRSANAAIDKVSVQFDEVALMLAAYGGSDLLCYRADGPEALIARQNAGWLPLLDWIEESFAVRLQTTVGLMPVAQDPKALNAIAAPLFSATAFELTAIHDLVALSGSLVLALAVLNRKTTPHEAWDLSRIDEHFQAEQWGADEEAQQMEETKRTAFFHAADLYQMVNLGQNRQIARTSA